MIFHLQKPLPLFLLLTLLTIFLFPTDALLGVRYASVATQSHLDSPNSNCIWDDDTSQYILTMPTKCWTVTSVAVVLQLGVPVSNSYCDNFEAPRFKCDFIPYYRSNNLLPTTGVPLTDFDCSTLSTTQAQFHNVCRAQWTIPSDNSWIGVTYTLLPLIITTKEPVSNLNDILFYTTSSLITDRTWPYSGFTSLYSPSFTELATVGSCQPCTTNCDLFYTNCPSTQFTMLCENQVQTESDPVLCTDSNSVQQSDLPCPLDSKYRRTAQIPTSCSVNSPEYTFTDPTMITNCQQSSLVELPTLDLRDAIITTDVNEPCPTGEYFTYKLMCGNTPCPTVPARLCSNQCATRDSILTSSSITCQITSSYGTPISPISYSELTSSSTPPSTHQTECVNLWTNQGYKQWYNDRNGKFCTSGCTVNFSCLIAPSLDNLLLPFGPCTADLLRGYISTDMATHCDDEVQVSVPPQRVAVKVTGPTGNNVISRSLLSSILNNNVDAAALLTALGAQNGPSLILPAYGGCTNAKILCRDKYDPTAQPTQELCNRMESLGPSNEITKLLSTPVYSSSLFQCSKRCDFGEYEVTQFCQYYDQSDPSKQLNIYPITSSQCFSAFSSGKLTPLTRTSAKCLQIDATCPANYRCTLGGTIISSEAACTTDYCSRQLSSPFCSPVDANPALTLSGSRQIDGCFFSGVKLNSDTSCTANVVTEFQCGLPQCTSTTPTPQPPVLPTSVGLQVYQQNYLTSLFNRVKQQGETETSDPNDVDGISMGTVIELRWDYTQTDDHIGYIEAKVDNFSFPIPVGIVSMHAKLYTIDLDNSLLFKKLKWGTENAVAGTRKIIFTLRALGKSYKTSSINVFSYCNTSSHISPLTCQDPSNSIKQGQCNGLLQRCDCYNGFYGINCEKEMCHTFVHSNDFSHTNECGQGGQDYNQCKVTHLDTTPYEYIPGNDILTSNLKTSCTCQHGSGADCSVHAECMTTEHQSCYNTGTVLSTFDWISTSLDLLDPEDPTNKMTMTNFHANPHCHALCTCDNSFFTPQSNCHESTLFCQNGADVVNESECQCKLDTTGTFCQCKPLGELQLQFSHRPTDYDEVETSWHQSLLKDIQYDTNINPQRFVFVSEALITDPNNADSTAWQVKYKIMECIGDDYRGIELFPGQSGLFTEASLGLIYQSPSPTSSSLLTQSLHSLTPMDEHTAIIFHQLAEPTTYDDISTLWNDLATLPSNQQPTTSTYTGPANEAAGGLSHFQPVVVPPDTNPPVVDPPVDPEPEPTKGKTNTLMIVLIAILAPCVVFICLLIILCICAKKQLFCWSKEFKEKQELEMNTFQDENGNVLITANASVQHTKATDDSMTNNMTGTKNETISGSSPAAANRTLGLREGRGATIERSEFNTECVDYTRERNSSATHRNDGRSTGDSDATNSGRTVKLPLDFDFGGSQQGATDEFGNQVPVSSRDGTNSRRNSALPTIVPAEGRKPLPPGWFLMTNGEKPYYYNHETMQTSWVHPDKINPHMKLATMGLSYREPDEYDEDF